MSNHTVEMIGITQPSHFPPNPPPDCCIETCETDKLCIPYNKPDILQVISVTVTISICTFKVICTPVGKKLVIEAVKNIKIMYAAADPCQSVHTAHFTIPFCMFVVLKNPYREVADLCTAVEYVSLNKLDCRSLVVSVLIFACPTFKPYENCPCKPCTQPVEHFFQDSPDPCNHSCKTEVCTICHNVKPHPPACNSETNYQNQCHFPCYFGK